MGSKSAIGIGNGICFKQIRNKGGGSYIDPLVCDSIVGLWKSDQNTNESPTRNIIKNTIKGKGGDLELLNFGYKLNSGYGGYIEDFSLFTLSNRFEYSEISNTKVTITAVLDNSTGIYHSVTEENSALYWNTFKIKVSGSTDDVYISYTTAKKNIRLYNGINTVVVPNELSWHSFSASTTNVSCNITLEFVPLYEGALVTDGKDDMIVSQKTVQEMLGGSNKITVVSMIHQIGFISSQNYARNNYFVQGNDFLTNTISAIGKIGIYGYKGNLSNIAIVNDILGDKKDYSVDKANPANIDSVFSVNGARTSVQLSQIAWYWTIIANKVLTTDQINQVISYFNLDKHVKPDIIYDTIRQGITNENHASFNDELVDFSGNGHNMKIYNSAWNKESGINDEGAWQTDGVSDYGKVENLPIYKDYTVVADREIVDGLIDNADGGVAVRGTSISNGAFGFDYKNEVYSFATPNSKVIDVERFISYQSKYVNNGTNINAGNIVDANPLTIGKLGSSTDRYSKLALWSFLLFPYSLSEFLLERQLKKYKLGTLYPDMVEFRPIINVNIGKTYNVFEIRRTDTNELLYYYINGSVPNNMIGTYLPKGTNIRILVKWDNNRADVTQIKFNGKEYELNRNSDNSYYINVTLDKSPQKIDIYADEYIRYEDIVQPYPAIINLKQDGKTITWGDKLKVGSEVTFVNHTNLLPDLYTVSGGVQYNGTFISWNTSIRVEKSMVFVNPHSYKKANEPNCILAPQTLRIPNSSYKILGYIPDLTGKGNHGRLNNFAYTEESGANEDGSIRFDGTDDHIIIPTIKHGGKALLMKVNWRYKNNIAMAYDQRINWRGLGISISRDQLPLVAYKPYNKVTYIDGIKNESVLVQDLEGITHNIIGIYDNLDLSDKRDVCISRTSDVSNSGFTDMSMYEFMLFPDVPNEEEIKELNDIVGIEGGYVESPNYYWDSFGKKNTDTDRNLIADQVSKDVANALEVKNVAYNSESGYTDDNGLLLDGVEDHAVNTVIPAVTDFTVIAKREFPESALVNNQTFLTKGDAINGNNNVNSLLMECYYGAQNYIISFSHQQIVPLEKSKISWITPTNYNGNDIAKGSGVDSVGLTIGRYKDLYRKTVFYKLMFYTKTIDRLSINMLKNLFERDELIDVTNPIFKKEEL
mgnify:CR=1 FL=1